MWCITIVLVKIIKRKVHTSLDKEELDEDYDEEQSEFSSKLTRWLFWGRDLRDLKSEMVSNMK